jgi:hypothetical protein
MMKPGTEKLMHGELTLDGHKFFVCDEFPASEGGTCKSPETLGGTGVRITLLVPVPSYGRNFGLFRSLAFSSLAFTSSS